MNVNSVGKEIQINKYKRDEALEGGQSQEIC